MTNSNSILNTYEDLVKAGEISNDKCQLKVIESFFQLQQQIILKKRSQNISFWQKFFSKNKQEVKTKQGIYLYGGVGRGKTFLMDIFFKTIPIKNKKREHFHAFMLKTHDELHKRRQGKTKQKYNEESAILDYAEELAKKYKLLCLDEMHVKDITDAMILGRLFTKLLDLGVFVVFTSNFKPEDLYKNGLQRELFLPFIDILNTRLEIINLDSDKDYRLDRAWHEGTWFFPITEENKEKFAHVFKTLSEDKEIKDIKLNIKGRELIVKDATDNIAKFDFATLFKEARGASDYLEIAGRFEIIFLYNLPKLNDNLRNETRRFITFIDTIYENKVKLVVLSENNIDNIYIGKENKFEFQRTISRLQEMQAKDYWEQD